MNKNTLYKEPLGPLFSAIADHAHALDLVLYVVGGFVRDALLDKTKAATNNQPNSDGKDDIDIVVEGNAVDFTRSLVERYGGTAREPSQFGTSTWWLTEPIQIAGSHQSWPDFIDFATARTESYEHPAALPLVRPGTLAQDLHRRDFTINAMAIFLTPPIGELIDLYEGEQDLRNGLIRILHDTSFIDDPTRIFRAIRFEQRLGFALEENTAQKLIEALPIIANLSGIRIQHELTMIFHEAIPEKAMRRLDQLGVLKALPTRLEFDEWNASFFENARRLVFSESAQLNWIVSKDSLLTAYWMLIGTQVANPNDLIKQLQLDSKLAHAVRNGKRIQTLLPQLTDDLKPSTVVSILSPLTPEDCIAAWALATPNRENPHSRANVRGYIAKYATVWHDVFPRTTGNDLIALGLKPGKHFGKLLSRLRDAWLDDVITNEAEEKKYLRELIDRNKLDDGC